MPVGLRSRVPAKITSSMRTPRRLLADCSPSTQEMESAILDFPQPLGPTTAAIPSPGNFSSVLSQKDLNPRICSFFSFSNVLLLLEWPIVTRRGLGPCKHLIHSQRLSSAGGEPMTPVNVPRELPGVKHKAHNMLWISGLQPSMSHRYRKSSRHSSSCVGWMRWRGESRRARKTLARKTSRIKEKSRDR